MKLFTTHRRVGLATVSVAVSALFTTTLGTAPANATPARTPATSSALPPEATTALEAAISATGTFDGRRAISAGVTQSTADDFATGWAAAGKPTRNASIDQAVIAKVREALPSLRACSGKNRWDYTGIQLNIYLDSCNTTRVARILGTAGGVTAAAAAITAVTGIGLAVAGTFAGLLTIAGGIVTICSARGKGVAIHNIPPGPAVWCNGQ